MPDQEVKPREISDDELMWMGKKLEQEAAKKGYTRVQEYVEMMLPQRYAEAQFSNPDQSHPVVGVLKGLWDATKGVGQFLADPVTAVKAVPDQMMENAGQARDLFNKGEYLDAAGHLGAAIPFIGPAAKQAGQTLGHGLGTGDWEEAGRGVGQGLGVLAPVLAPAMGKGVSKLGEKMRPEPSGAGDIFGVNSILRPGMGVPGAAVRTAGWGLQQARRVFGVKPEYPPKGSMFDSVAEAAEKARQGGRARNEVAAEGRAQRQAEADALAAKLAQEAAAKAAAAPPPAAPPAGAGAAAGTPPLHAPGGGPVQMPPPKPAPPPQAPPPAAPRPGTPGGPAPSGPGGSAAIGTPPAQTVAPPPAAPPAAPSAAAARPPVQNVDLDAYFASLTPEDLAPVKSTTQAPITRPAEGWPWEQPAAPPEAPPAAPPEAAAAPEAAAPGADPGPFIREMSMSPEWARTQSATDNFSQGTASGTSPGGTQTGPSAGTATARPEWATASWGTDNYTVNAQPGPGGFTMNGPRPAPEAPPRPPAEPPPPPQASAPPAADVAPQAPPEAPAGAAAGPPDMRAAYEAAAKRQARGESLIEALTNVAREQGLDPQALMDFVAGQSGGIGQAIQGTGTGAPGGGITLKGLDVPPAGGGAPELPESWRQFATGDSPPPLPPDVPEPPAPTETPLVPGKAVTGADIPPGGIIRRGSGGKRNASKPEASAAESLKQQYTKRIGEVGFKQAEAELKLGDGELERITGIKADAKRGIPQGRLDSMGETYRGLRPEARKAYYDKGTQQVKDYLDSLKLED